MQSLPKLVATWTGPVKPGLAFITRIRSAKPMGVVPAGQHSRLDGMHVVNNQDRTWASPAAAGPVSARVRLPASKSITNRALVLAALGDGPAVITSPLVARDTMLAADALPALGSEITESRTGWVVPPRPP